MKSILITFCCAVLTFLSVEAVGQSDSLVCNDCSERERARMAEQRAHNNPRDIIVVDFKSETANKYQVFYSEVNPQKRMAEVNKSDLSAQEVSDIQALFTYYKALIEVIKKAEDKSRLDFPQAHIPQTSLPSWHDDNVAPSGNIAVKGSPYEFITKSYMRNDIYDYYFSTTPNGLSKPVSRLVNFPNLDQVITVQFYQDQNGELPNGIVKVSLNSITKSFEVLSGRDKYKNSIPLEKREAEGSYVFDANSSEKTKFESYLAILLGHNKCKVTDTEKAGVKYIYTYKC